MDKSQGKILLIGYGNPGRGDDGLGPAVADSIQARSISGVEIDSDYQLTVEHAHDIAGYDTVIFADADTAGAEPFSLKRLQPGTASVSFSSHAVSPGYVLALGRDLFGVDPAAWILAVRGYDFNEFNEDISDQARDNMAAAVDFLAGCLVSGTIREFDPAPASRAGVSVPE